MDSTLKSHYALIFYSRRVNTFYQKIFCATAVRRHHATQLQLEIKFET